MKSFPESDVPQSPFLWSRGTAARETLRYLDRNGIDAEPLFPPRAQPIIYQTGQCADALGFLRSISIEAKEQILQRSARTCGATVALGRGLRAGVFYPERAAISGEGEGAHLRGNRHLKPQNRLLFSR